MSRFSGRFRIFSHALPRLLLKPWRRTPSEIKSILISHRLRLGDALLLAPFLKKLRSTYPHARIAVTCSPEMLPIFSGEPYGISVLPYSPNQGETIASIIASGPYDIAFVLGDNRYAWLALAAGSKWIVAHYGDKAVWKRPPIDELRLYPDKPAAWGDMVAEWVEGPQPHYAKSDWPVNAAAPFDLPAASGTYVVLHPGANSVVKQWLPERWKNVALSLEAQGILPVWSGGPDEVTLVQQIDPEARFPSFAGKLNLGQLWYLLANARALACPDTGIAHLGRVVGVPTLALFGSGSALVHGGGEFWADAPYIAETIDPLPCRNQQRLFASHVSWARRCDRDLAGCINRSASGPACMTGIHEDVVLKRLDTLLALNR